MFHIKNNTSMFLRGSLTNLIKNNKGRTWRVFSTAEDYIICLFANVLIKIHFPL